MKLRFIICLFFFTTEIQAQSFAAFRLDDLHLYENKLAFDIIDVFQKNNIPLNLGFIPNYIPNENNAIPLSESNIAKIKAGLANHALDIQMHGYMHKKNGVSEFTDIPFQQQKEWLIRGKQILDSVFTVSVSTFTPPWNEYDKNTLLALNQAGFNAISGNINGGSDNNIQYYLPATTEQWTQAIELMQIAKTKKSVVVFMLHTYQFNTPNDVKRLDSVLHQINQMQILPVLTFQKAFQPENKLFADRLQLHQLPFIRYCKKLGFDILNNQLYYPKTYLYFIKAFQYILIIIPLLVFGYMTFRIKKRKSTIQ